MQACDYSFASDFANPGLVYCRARYYDSVNARWLLRDPIGYDGGINLYAYCDGNPVMRTDPSGLQDQDINFVRGEIIKWQHEKGMWDAKNNHGANGAFDYKVKFPTGRFPVHGMLLSSSQFGQYAVGYAAYYNSDPSWFGLWGAQMGGHLLEALEDNYRDDREVGWYGDDGKVDKEIIMLGAVDAYMDLRKAKKEKPSWYGWQKYPGSNKQLSLKYIRNYNMGRTGTVNNRADSLYNQPQNSRADKNKRSRP